MADTICRIQRTTLASRPSHVQEPWAWATSLARMTADDSAPAGPSAMAAMVLEAGVMRAVRLDDSILRDATACYRSFIGGKSESPVLSLGERVAGGVANPSLELLMGEMDATLHHMPRGDLVSEFLACPFVTRPILCLGGETAKVEELGPESCKKRANRIQRKKLAKRAYRRYHRGNRPARFRRWSRVRTCKVEKS